MPRLNKRQQRELASLGGLEASQALETTQSDDDEALPSSSTPMRFAAVRRSVITSRHVLTLVKWSS